MTFTIVMNETLLVNDVRLVDQFISFSDRHETLVTVLGEEAENPGDRRAVSLESRTVNKMGRIQGSVEAVTVLDIMEKIQAPSYIIKTDIQKYDCKVRFSVIFITISVH